MQKNIYGKRSEIIASDYLKKKGYEVKILASSAIHNSTINMIEKHEKILFKEKEIDVIDIKFSVSSSIYADEQIYCFSALLMYK